ncbi:MAG TPA: hypothetical protein VM076_04370 [Gemmatimonadaceae bacterium]|nr:hypothetical protein [Gemmatimonadaceae bacterium]
MPPIIRHPLGILIIASAAAALSAAKPVAQAGAPTACSIIEAEQLKRLTGRQDRLKRGPMEEETSAPGKGRTGCAYLGFSFELASSMKPESFEQTRSRLVKGGATTQPLSGVGDAAFSWWSPKPGSNRPVGIVLRKGTNELMVMAMTTSDSIEAVKPQLLSVAKAVVAKLR